MPPNSREKQDVSSAREAIDKADQQLLELLAHRLELVKHIVPVKRAHHLPRYAPGREAMIMRQLAARRPPDLPLGNVLRLWRELLAATVALEGRLGDPPEEPFTVAVYEARGEPAYRDLARDHYGSHVGLHSYPSSYQVIQAVTGPNTMGILPLPRQGEAEPWWPNLRGDNAPNVIARLPFGPPGNVHSSPSGVGAFVIGHGVQQATLDADGKASSKNDRTLFVIETADPFSPTHLFSEMSKVDLMHGLRVVSDPFTLIEMEGCVLTDDARLGQLCDHLGIERSRLIYIGGYAEPLPESGIRL